MDLRPLRIFPVSRSQIFGSRNKIDLSGPARIAEHRDANKNGGEARPSSARIFVPRLRTSTPAHEMPAFAHVDVKNPFLHTLSVTDGKNFVFCTRSRLRTEKNSRPPAATSKEVKLCIFPITDGTKNRFWHTLSVTEVKKTHARILFFWRSTMSAGVRPLSSPIGPKQICDGKRRHSNAIFFSSRAGVHFFFFSCGNT